MSKIEDFDKRLSDWMNRTFSIGIGDRMYAIKWEAVRLA